MCSVYVGEEQFSVGELGVLDALNIILESVQRLGELGPGMLRLGQDSAAYGGWRGR